jgi:hypothetical protein
MPKRCPRRSSSPCPGLPYFSDCGWRATGTAAVFSTMRIARYLGAGGSRQYATRATSSLGFPPWARACPLTASCIDACGFVFAASPKRRPQVAAARHRARLDASFWWCARTYAGSRCRLLCCGHAASGGIRSDYCLSASQRLYHLHQHRAAGSTIRLYCSRAP